MQSSPSIDNLASLLGRGGNAGGGSITDLSALGVSTITLSGVTHSSWPTFSAPGASGNILLSNGSGTVIVGSIPLSVDPTTGAISALNGGFEVDSSGNVGASGGFSGQKFYASGTATLFEANIAGTSSQKAFAVTLTTTGDRCYVDHGGNGWFYGNVTSAHGAVIAGTLTLAGTPYTSIPASQGSAGNINTADGNGGLQATTGATIDTNGLLSIYGYDNYPSWSQGDGGSGRNAQFGDPNVDSGMGGISISNCTLIANRNGYLGINASALDVRDAYQGRGDYFTADIFNKLIYTNCSLSLNTSYATVAAAGAGASGGVQWSMPEQGSAIKFLVINVLAMTGTVTLTPTTAFAQTPIVIANGTTGVVTFPAGTVQVVATAQTGAILIGIL
jgi:hypothetical protein